MCYITTAVFWHVVPCNPVITCALRNATKMAAHLCDWSSQFVTCNARCAGVCTSLSRRDMMQCYHIQSIPTGVSYRTQLAVWNAWQERPNQLWNW
jgi:hypothetical protein